MNNLLQYILDETKENIIGAIIALFGKQLYKFYKKSIKPFLAIIFLVGILLLDKYRIIKISKEAYASMAIFIGIAILKVYLDKPTKEALSIK